jgi:hypothetical protein
VGRKRKLRNEVYKRLKIEREGKRKEIAVVFGQKDFFFWGGKRKDREEEGVG